MNTQRAHKWNFRLLTAAGLVAALLTVAAVNAVAPGDAVTASEFDRNSGQALRETFTREFDFPAASDLHIRNAYGHVNVSGWDGDTVLVTVQKRLDEVQSGFHWFKDRAGSLAPPTDDILAFFDALDITGDREDGALRISASRPLFMLPELSMSLHMNVQVPRDTDISVHTDNGTVSIQNVKGTLHASSINGKIACEDIRGKVNARTRNGELSFRSVEGGITARAANGSITVDDRELSRAYPISCATDNGGITLHVPLAPSFELAARTANGFVHTPLKIGDAVPHGAVRIVKGSVGEGGPSIDLKTLNGSIHIETL